MKISTINSDLIHDSNNQNDENGMVDAQNDVVKIERKPSFLFNKTFTIPIIIVLTVALISLFIYLFWVKQGEFISPLALLGNDSETIDSSKVPDKNIFINPLNGTIFPVEDAKSFRDRKPVAVMVNNFVEARPSSGLSKADVVYEAVAEGGITRLMPIFYSQDPETVGSVRSARYYFVELAAAYKAHFIHWGAAHVPPCQKEPVGSPKYCPPVGGKVETNPKVDAYSRIVQLGVPNLDGGNYSCDRPDCAFGRDPKKLGKIPLEHTAFVRYPLIFDLAKKIRPEASWHKFIPIKEWKFKDDAVLEDRGNIGLNTPITYNYWDIMPGFDVKWVYDKENNEYVRYQGGVKQVDADTGKELRAKVIVIRFTEQEKVGDKKNHLYHKLVGEGKALIFQDGKVVHALWKRDTHDERDVYFNLVEGTQEQNQVEFVRGQIWIQLVPSGNKVSYEGVVQGVSTVNTNYDSDGIIPAQ